MIPLNKRNIKLTKSKKPKTNKALENYISSFNQLQQNQPYSNLPNTRYLQQNTPIIYHTNTNTSSNLNSKDIKEIDIKNIPNEILFKNKKNRHQRNKIKNNIPIKTNSSYSYENISDNSIPKYQNNTFTPRTIETYEIPLGKNYCLNNKYFNRIKDRENKSMDITYYKPIIYINKNENNNSFCKKSENSEFFTQNNSFFMNGINLEENFNPTNINLNNTVGYNKEKYYKHKNSLSTINSIPRPQKFRKKIPPIPIKKINESNNFSFYFDENEINNNINMNTNTIPNSHKIKSGFNTDKNKLDSTNLNTITKTKPKNRNKKYSNKTYSIGYIKNIEKIGIQLSFSSNKLKNESIDLISPEVLKNLKQYSSEKQNTDIIYSDLDANKIKDFNHNEKIKNVQIFNIQEDIEKNKKKKYDKLSCYLLRNRKRKISNKIVKKDKYDIIDIKEKIKEEKRNRSLSNFFKYRKKEIIKDSPSATNIKKRDDIGGKIDLKVQNIKNKRYCIKKGIKRRIILNYLIKQCKITKSPLDKGEIIINAAKTIQKWWRDLISKIYIILQVIKIQSVFRSFIMRKKISKRKKYNSLSTSQKKYNFIYKKIISKTKAINNSMNNSNNFKSRNMKNNKISNMISNTSFKIVSNDELNASIKSNAKEELNNLVLIDKRNIKLCLYTKEYYQNREEKKIRFLQRYFKNYLNKINKYKFQKIIKYPLISLSLVDKVRYKNIIYNSPLNINPINKICLFTKNYILLKKKKPIVFSVTKMNYESIATANNKKKEIILEIDNKNPKYEITENVKNQFEIIENIYQIPILTNLCYIDKVFIKHSDKDDKKIKIIQNKYRLFMNTRKKETQKVYKKQLTLNTYISKEYKDNLINSNKISLIQKIFRKFIIKIKEEKNKQNLDEIVNNNKDNQDNQYFENVEEIINNLFKKRYINFFFDNLRKIIITNKEKYFLKMLIQRIKKIINQFTYEKIKIYFMNKLKPKKIINKIENKDINEIKDNNIENATENQIFFFNTIKRQIKINEIDNNLDTNNEIVKLLKESIPDYFDNYPKIKYIPYIKKRNEKNLINQQIFLFDDESLANYIYKCYQIEKNLSDITPEIIKKRLILEPLKNQNIFTITRYMDNLYNDYMKNKVCKICSCKNTELCLSGCKCHNFNNLKLQNQLKNLKNKDNNVDYFDENININLTINEESSNRNSKTLINTKKQGFKDIYSINSNLTDIKKSNTFTRDQIDINNENDELNSINTDYNNKNHNHKKINNFIRNFALRKKLRNSIKSDLSNVSNQNAEMGTINFNFNLNNNVNERSSEKINLSFEDDQSNVYEDEIKIENSIKKIHKSLLKKKMKTIDPIPNHIRNIMRMATNFRNQQKKERRKEKEIIKLRDSFVNMDYEYYEK